MQRDLVRPIITKNYLHGHPGQSKSNIFGAAIYDSIPQDVKG